MDSSASESLLDFVPPSSAAVLTGEQFLTVFEMTTGDFLSTDGAGRNGEINGKVPVMAAIDWIEFEPGFRNVTASEAGINRNVDGVTM